MADHPAHSEPNFMPLIVGTIVLVAIIIVLAYLVVGARAKPEDPALASARIKPVASVEVAAAGAAEAGARTGEQLFQSACVACHSTGAAGAPKVGDKAAWAPRIAQGLKGLLASATKGKNAMPPKGGSTASQGQVSLNRNNRFSETCAWRKWTHLTPGPSPAERGDEVSRAAQAALFHFRYCPAAP